ncbi:MAG: methylenetetrahydrofolate reductase [Sphingobium sp.]|jgi:methylenetetrahydrofolate reductase (NADPH)|nr:methylenetetrahydrofolate reductase [Sphingobium sp.]MCP5400027.1 methylenetetrahydrofolate reductase [Sphingomonas sp.]
MRGYSLEITTKDTDRLAAAADLMEPGAQVSVTFLPGDTVDRVAEVSAAVRKLGLEPVPHCSARRLRSEDELLRFMKRLRDDAGAERMFVVAGDPAEPMGPYEDALAVIQSGILLDHGIRQVGISGYPDGHPQISLEKLMTAMQDKLAALEAQGLAAEIMTQFVFDAEAVIEWLTNIRNMGVSVPVRVGVPGPATIQSLLRFAARCGVGASAKVMAKYGVSITKLLSTATPDRLIVDLARSTEDPAFGDVLIHLYPFGGIGKALEWAASFSAEASEC